MRLAFLAAALALGACGPKAPEGSSAYRLSPDDRDFRFDALSRRVLFVRGTFPDKSYVGSLDLAAGRLSLHRSMGRKVIGLPAGGSAPPRALFSAAELVDNYTGEAPKGEVILQTAPGDAGSDRTAKLDEGRHAVCLVETSWSGGVLVAAASADRGTKLARWKSSGSELEAFAALPSDIADCGAAAGVPRLGLLIVKEASASYRVWDVAANREASSLGLPPNPKVVGRASDGRLFAAWLDKDEGIRRLAALDPATGALTSLYRSSDTIVSAAAHPSGSLALVRDDRERGGIASHLKPQTLVKLDARGRVEWTRPWSRLPSRLAGYDAATGRVLIVIADPEYNALWAVPLDEPAYAAAVADLERRTSPLRRRMGMARNILVSAAFVLILLVGLYSVAR